MKIKILFIETIKEYFKILYPALKKILNDIPTNTAFIDCISYNNVNNYKNEISFFIISEEDFKNPLFKNTQNLIILNKTKNEIINEKNICFIHYPDKTDYKEKAIIIYLFCKSIFYKIKYNDNLKIIEAFNKLTDFSREELMNAKKILDAHEKIQELSRQELLNKEKIINAEEQTLELGRQERIAMDQQIKATEKVEELATNERKEKDRIIKAWEIFYNIVRNELMELKKNFQAEEQVLELSKKEIEERDKTIKAFDKLSELSRQELLESKKEFKAEETLLELNRLQEIKEETMIENLSDDDIKSILHSSKLWNHLLEEDKENLIELIKNLFKIIIKNKKSFNV